MAQIRAQVSTSVPSVAPGASSDRRRGIALCLVSACGFGLMAIIAKEAYAAGLGVTSLLAARFVVAASVFWAIVALRPKRTRPAPRLVFACLALGCAGYAAQAGFFFSALQHIDASLTSLLLYTYPALVFCAAVALRREHFTPLKAGALVLASAGAALVLLGGGTGGLEATGVLLALGAAATYTAYILVADGVVARIDPFLMSALVTTGAAATFLMAGVASGGLHYTGEGWIWIVAIALLSTVLPIVTFMVGMRSVGAATASIVSTVEPVVTVTLAVLLFGDGLGPAQVLGGVLVLAAVVVLQARGLSTVGRRVAPAHAAGPAPARAPAGETA
jgi:drug/metabolite transporter (DMT)-like permease